MLEYALSSSSTDPNVHKLTQNNGSVIASLYFRKYLKLLNICVHLAIKFSHQIRCPNYKLCKCSSFQLRK